MAQRMNYGAARGGFQPTRGGAPKPQASRIDPAKGEEEEILGKEAGAETSASPNDEVAAAEQAAADADIVAEAEAVIEDVAKEGDELEAAKKEAADWQDRYMRLHAEWDTYRRRTTEQQAQEKKRATEKLMEDLLPVLDDFQRSIDYAEQNGSSGLLDGVKAVETKLIDTLVKSGLEVIDPVGEAYNALEAQAVGTVSDTEAYDETVKEVYQKGYKLGNKVIRPAMVTVTTGGPQRPKDEEQPDQE